jgi:hypothetical protein
MSLAVHKSRIQAVVHMMKLNTSIRTIDMDHCLSTSSFYRESVVSYVETNRFRPRLLTIQKTRPFPYRAKVLGRALVAVRTDPNRIWMLLSGNAEVAFPSTNTTIAAASNLPTPAAVAAPVNVVLDVAAATASVMAALR